MIIYNKEDIEKVKDIKNKAIGIEIYDTKEENI